MEHRFRCCICKKTFNGYGNNPWPLKEKGQCCNSCNEDVTLARLAYMVAGKEMKVKVKNYLEDENLKRAKICDNNITDKMRAISKEIWEVEKPNKRYLLEKLESVAWDVNVLIRMCKGGDEDEEPTK